MKRKQAIESVKAFLPNDKHIEKIINICDLYPVENSWKKWTDHLGSYIKLHKNKKVIAYIYSSKDTSEYIVTDLYFKSPPSSIVKISKWAFISFAQTGDIPNIIFIWFLGNDNRLRLLSYKDGIWTRNHPPLISGIKALRFIIDNFNYNGQVKTLPLQGPLKAKIIYSYAMNLPGRLDDLISFNSTLGKELEKIMN